MKRRHIVLVFLAMILSVVSPIFAGEEAATDKPGLVISDKDIQEQIRLYFEDALDVVEKDILDLTKRIDKLDFGPFVGIGILLSLPADERVPQVVVYGVIKDRPADTAGVKAEDVVLSVNGKSVSSLEEAIKEIRGDNSVGREVTLELDRKGVKVLVTMTTDLLRGDRREEAERLREAIEQESLAMLGQMISTFADAVVEFDEMKKDYPIIKAAFKLIDDHNKWYLEQIVKIYNLYDIK